MTGFNLSRMVGYTGACYVYLHRPNDALAALQEALELLDSQAIRRKSTLLATMAMAHVQQKEIEEACRLAHQALLITRQTRSIRVLTRIRRLKETLEPWKTIPLVKDLGEHITTVFTTITS